MQLNMETLVLAEFFSVWREDEVFKHVLYAIAVVTVSMLC